MTSATLTDLQADAAWFWEREAWAAGRAAFERTFNKDERAGRRFDFIARANRACALKADDALRSQAHAIRLSHRGAA